MLAERVKTLKPAATIELSTKIREMKRSGVDIISLNIGEPDFAPPAAANDGVRAALDQNISKYGPVPGFPELREAICEKLRNDNGLTYRPDEICVSAGAKQAIFNALFALCGAGDEVLLPTPCWVSYDQMVNLCGATPVPVRLRLENGFALDVDAVERCITPRTRAIVINTPNNPTGAVYSEESLCALGRLAVKYDFWIISDEIYEKILFNGNTHFSVASVSEDVWSHCVTINGFSKAYALPGWRVGYSAAPRTLAKAISSIQGHVTSATASLSQMGALYAMRGAAESVKLMAEEYAARMVLTGDMLDKIPDILFNRPQGTFYYFLDVSAYLGRRFDGQIIEASDALSRFILEQAHVAVVPGEAFSLPMHLRLSFSNSRENIIEGVSRMAQAFAALK
ncbi:pyridoxal phosphate-dependent aminotransferase [Faecalicatena sp. BF-R-105]|nr:pyridoxal phosphate-dependent aminotransferase [Faecalicatena sp. BF-R-105]